MYGREMMSPVNVIFNPFSNVGPIINKAEMYCELTFPGRVMWLLVSVVLWMGTQFTEGIDQHFDGALLHPFGTGNDSVSRSDGQVGGKESHGGTCGHDVDGFTRLCMKGTNHDLCIVAIR